MPRRRLKIWITRAQPGADATAERVRALGHDAIVGPLLAVQNLPGVHVELAGVGALAFTSGNGVRAFAALSGERSLRVFAVGQATAQAARAAGFRSVLSSDGDVDALALGISQRRNEIRGVVLHPGAAEMAGDLPGALERFGVPANRLVVYETVPVTLEPAFAASCAACDVALVHSARAGKLLAAILKANPAPKMKALGLSKAVLAPLSRIPLAERAFPSMPLEAALINLIDGK
jgi:uroporphyrinogen-III synthase